MLTIEGAGDGVKTGKAGLLRKRHTSGSERIRSTPHLPRISLRQGTATTAPLRPVICEFNSFSDDKRPQNPQLLRHRSIRAANAILCRLTPTSNNATVRRCCESHCPALVTPNAVWTARDPTRLWPGNIVLAEGRSVFACPTDFPDRFVVA
jgi:hypothetical protein